MAFRVRREIAREEELLKTTFFITVSTNQDLGELTDRAKVWLDRKITHELENYAEHLQVFRVGDDDKMYLQDLDPSQIIAMITNLDAELQIEVGDIRHRLHAHATISFSHSPRYRFRTNLPSFRGKFPAGFHVHVKYVKDHNFDLARYIRKQQQ